MSVHMGRNKSYGARRSPAGMQGSSSRVLNPPAAYKPEKDGDHRDYQKYVDDVANAEYKCSQ